MNYLSQRSFYVQIDPELRVVHTDVSKCPGGKIGHKYNYLKPFTIVTPDDAEKLDKQGLRACDWCLKQERLKRKRARRDPHISPPGFRH
jgi:hypothetical protein